MNSMKITLSRSDLLKVRTAAVIVEKDPKQHLSIEELAQRVYLNVSKLKTGFKQEYGVGPYKFLQQTRMRMAREMLLDGNSIRKVAIAVGFIGEHAETNFIKWFKKYESVPPGIWKVSLSNPDQKSKEKNRMNHTNTEHSML